MIQADLCGNEMTVMRRSPGRVTPAFDARRHAVRVSEEVQWQRVESFDMR
jgi:hypothetical protein